MPNRSFTLLPTVVIDSEADESPNHIPILSPFGRTDTTAPLTCNGGDLIYVISCTNVHHR